MGITFRSGEYVCFVRIGGRTIKDGEAAVIWKRNGIAIEEIGPKRVSLFFSTIRFLSRYKAEPHQYLSVKHRSGKKEHIPGPISMYLNPALHDGIKVNDGIKLETKNDCIVVFSSKEENHHVFDNASSSKASKNIPAAERRIVCGPIVYFPSVGETIHQFQWSRHSLPNDNGDPGNRTFHTLTMHKQFLWIRHLSIQTATVQLNLKLAISYEIGDSIEDCLSVDDPTPVLEVAILNDSTTASTHQSETGVLEWISNVEESFPALSKTMASVGFRLLKIQVLEIEQLKGSKEKVEQEKQEAQRDRSHEIDDNIQMAEKLNLTKLKFLKGLQDIGVDVTQVLCANKGNVETIADNVSMMMIGGGGGKIKE